MLDAPARCRRRSPRAVPGAGCPEFTTDSERVVWEHLRARLGDDDLLVANLRLTDRSQDHELDLVVGLAGHGVVVLEVEGGAVRCESDGRWTQPWNQGRRVIDPVKQARGGRYALLGDLDADPRWRRRRVRWGHSVVLPFTNVDDDFATPDCPRWAAIAGRHDVADLRSRLADLLDHQEHPNPVAGAKDLSDLRRDPSRPDASTERPPRPSRRTGRTHRPSHPATGDGAGRHPPPAPRRDPRWSRQRQDVARGRAGGEAERVRTTPCPAVLLARAGAIPAAALRVDAAQPAAGVRRDIPRSRRTSSRQVSVGPVTTRCRGVMHRCSSTRPRIVDRDATQAVRVRSDRSSTWACSLDLRITGLSASEQRGATSRDSLRRISGGR